MISHNVADDQHSLPRTMVLHLLPGALITLCYLVAAPLVRAWGFPSLMAIFLAILLVLLPFQLGYLRYRARRAGVPLGSIILYRRPMPRRQLAALVVGLFAYSSVLAVLLYPPLDRFFLTHVFFWVPESFLLAEDFTRYSSGALLATWVFGLMVNGVAGPIMEEMYFRGYLLPRISRLGVWAPLLNAVLFSLYHFFTPWQNLGRILGLLPMVYAVWWKQNLYLGMLVHCLGNVASMLLLLPVPEMRCW